MCSNHEIFWEILTQFLRCQDQQCTFDSEIDEKCAGSGTKFQAEFSEFSAKFYEIMIAQTLLALSKTEMHINEASYFFIENLTKFLCALCHINLNVTCVIWCAFSLHIFLNDASGPTHCINKIQSALTHTRTTIPFCPSRGWWRSQSEALFFTISTTLHA